MLTPEEQEHPLKAELDELLLSEIETRLATGVYGPDKRHQVRLYLDQKALALEKAAQAEQVEIARGANTRATVALIISALSALDRALSRIQGLVAAKVRGHEVTPRSSYLMSAPDLPQRRASGTVGSP